MEQINKTDMEGGTLYFGDCFDIFPSIEEKSVDMILADLPYGTTACKWDSILDLPRLWSHYERIIKPNGAIVLTASQPFTSILVCSNLPLFKYDWVWKKPKGTGHLNAKRQPMRDKEDILVFCKGQSIYNPQKTIGSPYRDKAGKDHSKKTSTTDCYGDFTNYREVNTGFRYPKQVLEFGVVERGTLHPTQKPVALFEYLIKTYTNEGEVVLDNTMGSGTTCVAAKNTNRRFIGIEKEEKYYDIAVKRLSSTLF